MACKISKIYTRKDGYQCIYVDGKRKYYHRYLAELYLPNPYNLPVINHKDGNPSNNSLDNLEWCTQKDNLKHARETGLWGKNILDKRKFNNKQIEDIKSKYIPRKYTIKKIADEYNVDYKTIWCIINNKSYV
jgi:hypothetical protein